MRLFGIIAAGGVVAFIWWVGFRSGDTESHVYDQSSLEPSPVRPRSAPKAPVTQETKQWTEEQRKGADSIIAKLQESGAIGDVRLSNRVVKVETGPEFLAADFKQKQDLAAAFLAWGQMRDENCKNVRLLDKTSGNDVGTFNESLGLKMK